MHPSPDVHERIDGLRAGLSGWADVGTPFDARPYVGSHEDLFAFLVRREIVGSHGFCLPGPSFPKRAGRFGPLVEVGAGVGYLSALLRAHGCDAIATDPGHRLGTSMWSRRMGWDVLDFTAEEAIDAFPDRAVLCSWPSLDDPWAELACARIQPGRVLLVVGEGWGGCTGTDGLHQLLEDGFESLTTPDDHEAVVQWPGIHDRLTVWRRV